ncbi:MAG: cell division protein [Planctomycetia bacterium]|nr:cell division protein [Planctomycetia bacterium]
MALTGTFERSLDDKNRIAVPKPLREEFSMTSTSSPPTDEVVQLYVAPGQDKSLSLYSKAGFDALAQRLASSSSSRAEVLNFQRLLFSRAEKVELDGQGRIRIPERLAEFAQLKRDVMLLGVQDHAEIWDKGVWAEFEQRHAARFDEMAQAAFA